MKRKPEPFFPPPRFDPAVEAGTVKVVRPDPGTGEVVEAVLPVAEFAKPAKKKARRKGPDPLAGQREAINESEIEHLLFEDEGKGCPVKPGDIFKLRSCHIEITRCHRVQPGGVWKWRSEFRRQYPEPQRHLRRNGGYTTSTFLGVPDPETNTEPESVPRDYQRLISEEAEMDNARKQAKARARVGALDSEAKVAGERRRGKPGTLAEAEFGRAQKRLRRAA